MDDERVSEACPHRQQEWMMRGFLRFVPHTQNTETTKVDDERVSEACPHTQMSTQTDNKSG